MMFMKVFALLFAVISLSCQASLIRADFRTESNLPDFGNGLPLVYQSLDQQVGTGFELDSADFLQNPDDWQGGEVWIDYDPLSSVLTLLSRDDWDFQTFDAWISNIVFSQAGETIANIVLLTNNLTQDGIVPFISVTDNSLHISYSAGSDVFLFSGGSATFKIETLLSQGVVTAAVPEPASVLLLMVGVCVLAYRLNKRIILQ
ncbi:PEP-CTERM sorting domain-containing protein [Bowmanella sp. Y26]|uniref:PEP-CTERM sorting domain-containing protein n=1 Tax=Bowmanella yangjiangensis TaxID=2811230 RepID=UPI001BDD844B|nr:PEP-CTERM sorting domain-containing protein [Bowmanella yangjiangensis]MBT1065547.1 PEP-CTERM sorting domain-containing protein [Bowmanella yangjiangensis]